MLDTIILFSSIIHKYEPFHEMLQTSSAKRKNAPHKQAPQPNGTLALPMPLFIHLFPTPIPLRLITPNIFGIAIPSFIWAINVLFQFLRFLCYSNIFGEILECHRTNTRKQSYNQTYLIFKISCETMNCNRVKRFTQKYAHKFLILKIDNKKEKHVSSFSCAYCTSG